MSSTKVKPSREKNILGSLVSRQINMSSCLLEDTNKRPKSKVCKGYMQNITQTGWYLVTRDVSLPSSRQMGNVCFKVEPTDEKQQLKLFDDSITCLTL